MTVVYLCDSCEAPFASEAEARECEAIAFPLNPPTQGLILSSKDGPVICTGGYVVPGMVVPVPGGLHTVDWTALVPSALGHYWLERSVDPAAYHAFTNTTTEAFFHALAKCGSLGWTPYIRLDGQVVPAPNVYP